MDDSKIVSLDRLHSTLLLVYKSRYSRRTGTHHILQSELLSGPLAFAAGYALSVSSRRVGWAYCALAGSQRAATSTKSTTAAIRDRRTTRLTFFFSVDYCQAGRIGPLALFFAQVSPQNPALLFPPAQLPQRNSWRFGRFSKPLPTDRD